MNTNKLSTIQKREKLNDVYRLDNPGPGNAHHSYSVLKAGASPDDPNTEDIIAMISFQKGPRKDPESQHGVIDTDLLEIVRDRLIGFQSGDFATEYNAKALEHLELALMYMNRRVEDRIERSVLGTYNK